MRAKKNRERKSQIYQVPGAIRPNESQEKDRERKRKREKYVAMRNIILFHYVDPLHRMNSTLLDHLLQLLKST